jgi:hypothetical protein
MSLSLGALALSACGSSTPAAPQAPAESVAPAPTEPTAAAAAERPALTDEQCKGQGGTVVGDIGDGATSRPEYVCPSGGKPLGNLVPAEGGPRPIEGSVCCPQ